MAVSDWATTAASNASTLGIDIGENCDAANINNALREALAQIKVKFDSVDASVGSGSSGSQPLDAQLTALAALSPAANQAPYFTSSTAAALMTVTAFARTLLDDADAATACATLGALRVTAYSLANPGYVKIQIATGAYFQVAWGTFSATANSTTSITYAAAFPTASFCLVNAGRQNTGAQDNDAFVSATTASGATVYSASDTTNSGYYLAVGF